MNVSIVILFLLLACLIELSRQQHYRDYTTNVYGRQPFECYSCTNNYDSANSRGRYSQASSSCGFAELFNPRGSSVGRELCYTYCLKKEVGIVGSRIDVERRCDPTCQEYNGNTRAKYLIDRVSCCVGNLCNNNVKLHSNISVLILLKLIFLKSFFS